MHPIDTDQYSQRCASSWPYRFCYLGWRLLDERVRFLECTFDSSLLHSRLLDSISYWQYSWAIPAESIVWAMLKTAKPEWPSFHSCVLKKMLSWLSLSINYELRKPQWWREQISMLTKVYILSARSLLNFKRPYSDSHSVLCPTHNVLRFQ